MNKQNFDNDQNFAWKMVSFRKMKKDSFFTEQMIFWNKLLKNDIILLNERVYTEQKILLNEQFYWTISEKKTKKIKINNIFENIQFFWTIEKRELCRYYFFWVQNIILFAQSYHFLILTLKSSKMSIDPWKKTRGLHSTTFY